MLFNSIDFAVFLPLVFLMYWFVFNKSIKGQNLLLLIASYIFYAWWDYRFLALILFSTSVDYFIGLKLANLKKKRQRKCLLWLSVFINLGLLGFFKYFNFFIENFTEVFSFFGHKIGIRPLSIVLPIGISFYTFQTLSYTIDVYRNNLKPVKDFISFAAFVTFFPQLVAGPIERATHLLPQFYKKRTFKYQIAIDGMRQILWGLFKKIVIADNSAVFANRAFENYEDLSGSTLFFGAFFFAIQIYGDFSGYSDIAIGTARLFGFDLKKNFSFPYFSRNIAEFWRRWHISLSTWFRDYVYIPIGGSRGSKLQQVRNIFVIFIVSGFWHGANWTFIIWGTLNALYFLPVFLLKKNRKYMGNVANNKLFPSFNEMVSILTTFFLTLFAWIFFRADNLAHALAYIKIIFSKSILSLPKFESPYISAKIILIMIVLFFIIEWFQRDKEHGLERIELYVPNFLRWVGYFMITLFLLYFGVKENEFIYFQF